MKLGPLATTVGTAAVVGGTLTTGMIIADDKTSRDALTVGNTMGIPLLGLGGIMGGLGAIAGGPGGSHTTALHTWGQQSSRVSEFTRPQTTMAVAGGALLGIGMANLAANVVLDINKDSLVDSY